MVHPLLLELLGLSQAILPMLAQLSIIRIMRAEVLVMVVRTVKVMAMVRPNNTHIHQGRAHWTSRTMVTKGAAVVHRQGHQLQASILVQVGCWCDLVQMYNPRRSGRRPTARLGVVWWWSNKSTRTIWWEEPCLLLLGLVLQHLQEEHNILPDQAWLRSRLLLIQWEAIIFRFRLKTILIISRLLSHRRNNCIRKTWSISWIQILRHTMMKGKYGSPRLQTYHVGMLLGLLIAPHLLMDKASFSTDRQLIPMRDTVWILRISSNNRLCIRNMCHLIITNL